MKNGFKSFLGALAIAGAAAIPSVQAKETINVGICVSWPGYAMLKVAQEKNLVPDYDMNITIFEDPLGGHSALAAGQIDVYGCTADYIPLTVDSGTDVVNVAFMNPSYGVDHIILAPDVKPEDLPGKKVSAPQAYTSDVVDKTDGFASYAEVKPDGISLYRSSAGSRCRSMSALCHCMRSRTLGGRKRDRTVRRSGAAAVASGQTSSGSNMGTPSMPIPPAPGGTRPSSSGVAPRQHDTWLEVNSRRPDSWLATAIRLHSTCWVNL